MATKLSDTAIRKKKFSPGLHPAGPNLYLQVSPAGTKSWIFRFMHQRKARYMGLGPYLDPQGVGVSLAQARAKAAAARQLLLDGVDPIEHRNAGRGLVAAPPERTFGAVAETYIAANEAQWRNIKHREQWRASLSTHAVGLKALQVASITTEDVLACLETIWTTKTETASRVRQRIEAVLDYATVRKYRHGENPARWRGHLDKLLPKVKKVARVRHHPAMSYREVPAFMAALRKQDGVAALALDFTILTAARTGEVIGARWDEVDLRAKEWVVPAARMKAGREHRVPLSPAAVRVLRKLKADKTSDWIFPNDRSGEPLSNMAMLSLLRRMSRKDITVHGFRSAFKDWCGETTSHPPEISEMALAHTVRNQTEAAYRRGDLFEKRRKLMRDWATYCAKRPARRAK